MERKMEKRVISGIMLTLILTSTLNVTFVIKSTFAQSGENNVLCNDFMEKINETILNKDTKPDQSNDLSDNWRNIHERKPDAKQNETLESSSQTLRYGGDKWNFNDTSEWSNFAYVDGNKTRLIVGVNGGKPTSFTELEKIAAEHKAKIVNMISIGGEIRAIVVELLLFSVTAFVQEIHVAGLTSYIEPNMKVQAQFVPNDPYWSWQWGPQKIEADWAWNITIGDPSVLVAVVDTGIYYYHADIAPNYFTGGYDWANNDTDPLDDHGHGTHCAGIIAAVLNNSIGIAGLAQVRVMAEKVLTSGGWGYWDWVANGIIHATDSGADIISMSLGGYGYSELVHEAVKYAYDSGVLLIAAAGNDNTNMKLYPAGYDEVIAVAATDQYDNKAWFSNWGNWIEFAAPGVDIYSVVPWGYESWSGTSMATPHVSGVAALVWSRYPEKTRDWVRLWLRYTADDLGDLGFDVYYGYGRINARKAVEQTPPAHELIAYEWTTPPYVKLGAIGNINATVLNFGENDEIDIAVQLIANGTIVDSTLIDSLTAGNLITVSLSWNPMVEGLYNVTFYVVPVPDETSLENNVLWTYIYVGFPVKAVVLHSAGNIYGDIIINWQVLNNEWYLFGGTMVYIDYTTLNKEGITYEDIAATEADVLIISCAYDPWMGWQFIDSEIEAIKRYVYEGHGLIATAGTIYYYVPNNNKLALLFGLNETITWYGTSTDLLHVEEPNHPLFTKVPNPFIFRQVATNIPSDWRWDANELIDGEYMARGNFKESAIVVRRGLVYISPWLEIIPPYYHHHLQLLYNAITWSRYQKPQHELVVSLEAPKYLQPGESALLNATVYNMGLNNETDVELHLLIDGVIANSTTIPELLVGASYKINYLWTPTVEKIYNVTAYSPPLRDEEFIFNNVDSSMIYVRFVRFVLWDDTKDTDEDSLTGNYLYLYQLLTASGFIVNELPIGPITSTILANYDILVLMDPELDFSPSEISDIQNWVATGGALIIIPDGGYPPTTNTLMAPYGVQMTGRVGGYGTTTDIVSHPITQDVGAIYVDWVREISVTSPSICLAWVTEYGERYAFLSAMESGEVIVVSDSNIMDNYGLGMADNAQLMLNIFNWVGIRPEHDLAVTLEAPAFLEPSTSVLLNATVYNRGLSNETDVELQLLINGTAVDSVLIPELVTEASYMLSYLWTSIVEGTYNITAYALPVPGEEFIANNVATKIVSVRPIKYVLFDQTHGTDSITSYSTWVMSLTERGYVVETHTTGPITPAVLEGYDVFVIPQAWDSYSADELLAIRNFVFYGGGLLVIGDDKPWIYTDLTSFAGITWTGGGTSGITTDITPHPVTTGVTSVYLDSPVAIMYITGVAQDLVRDPAGNIMLAVSEQPSGKVIGFADENSLWNYAIGQADNLRLANNMIDWLAIRYRHDLAVSLAVPAFIEFGNTTMINATVRNSGLNNETNVELYLLINGTVVNSATIPELLVGEFYIIHYVWTPTRTGNYNITAYAPPVPEEEYTANNIVTRPVCVFFYQRLYLPHEWVGGGDPMGWHADDSSWQYTLPFDFPFYGVNYRTIYISSNGLITFIRPDNSYWNSIPELASRLAIAPAWDDWVTYDPYNIYIWQNSTHIGIRWYVRAYGSSTVANFEAILCVNGIIQFNYAYNDGPVSTTIGISNGAGHILAEDVTNLNYINTIVFTPFLPEHELVVTLEAPPLLELGISVLLNATVRNMGLSNETNVELQILINGTVVQSITIPEFLVGDSYTLSYLWTPTVEATYNVTAYATPVLGEEFTANNIATKIVKVRPIKGYILFDQTHGTDSIAYYSIWVANLTDRGYVVETHTSGPITSAILEGYNVFVIPQAHYYYTSDELSAIQNFVLNGGGLLVIGDDVLSIYTDLTSFAGITWMSGGAPGVTTDIKPHEVTSGVSSVCLANPEAKMTITGPAQDIIRDTAGCITLAVSLGHVIGFVDEDSLRDLYIGYADNLLLANNMIDWLATPKPLPAIRDVAIVSVAVSVTEVYAGWTVNVTVVAINEGNMTETVNVTAYYDNNAIATKTVTALAPGENATLTFNWNTTRVTPCRNYTIKAIADTVLGETDTADNTFIDGTVKIKLMGDVSGDGMVDAKDVALIIKAFGSYPGHPRWNPELDLNRDGKIGAKDIALTIKNYGKTCL